MKPWSVFCLGMTFLSLCGSFIIIPFPDFLKISRSLGDLNADGVTNKKDVVILEQNFGSHNEVADINNDTVVDICDALVVSAHYGQVWFPLVSL